MTHPRTPTAGRQPYPWIVPDLFRWFFLLGLSVVGIVVAWWGVSGTASTGTQITWVNVGGAAVVVGGLGNMSWLLQGRRAVALRRRELLTGLTDVVTVTAELSPDDAKEMRVSVPGASRYHRSDCAAVDGKPVKQMTLARHERAGRRPCGLCGGG